MQGGRGCHPRCRARVILPLTQAAFPWCLAGAGSGRHLPPAHTERFCLLLLSPARESAGWGCSGATSAFPAATHANARNFQRRSCLFQPGVSSKPRGAVVKARSPRSCPAPLATRQPPRDAPAPEVGWGARRWVGVPRGGLGCPGFPLASGRRAWHVCWPKGSARLLAQSTRAVGVTLAPHETELMAVGPHRTHQAGGRRGDPERAVRGGGRAPSESPASASPGFGRAKPTRALLRGGGWAVTLTPAPLPLPPAAP